MEGKGEKEWKAGEERVRREWRRGDPRVFKFSLE